MGAVAAWARVGVGGGTVGGRGLGAVASDLVGGFADGLGLAVAHGAGLGEVEQGGVGRECLVDVDDALPDGDAAFHVADGVGRAVGLQEVGEFLEGQVGEGAEFEERAVAVGQEREDGVEGVGACAFVGGRDRAALDGGGGGLEGLDAHAEGLVGGAVVMDLEGGHAATVPRGAVDARVRGRSSAKRRTGVDIGATY